MRIKLLLAVMILVAALISGCIDDGYYDRIAEMESADPTPPTSTPTPAPTPTPIPYTKGDWQTWEASVPEPMLDIQLPSTTTNEESMVVVVSAPWSNIEIYHNGALISAGAQGGSFTVYFDREGDHEITVNATQMTNPPSHLQEWGPATKTVTRTIIVAVDWSPPGLAAKPNVFPVSGGGEDGMAVILVFDEKPKEVMIAYRSAFPVGEDPLTWGIIIPWEEIILQGSFPVSFVDTLGNGAEATLAVVRPYNRAELIKDGMVVEVNRDPDFWPDWAMATFSGKAWNIYRNGQLVDVAYPDWTPVKGVIYSAAAAVAALIWVGIIFAIFWWIAENKQKHQMRTAYFKSQAQLYGKAPIALPQVQTRPKQLSALAPEKEAIRQALTLATIPEQRQTLRRMSWAMVTAQKKNPKFGAAELISLGLKSLTLQDFASIEVLLPDLVGKEVTR